MNGRRVVVTGLGLLTSLGDSVDQVWGNIISGNSGVKTINHYDVSDIATKFSSTAVDYFKKSEEFTPKELKRSDLFVHYGRHVCRQAMLDAGLKSESLANPDRCSVLFGTGIGGLQFIDKNAVALDRSGPKRVSPYFVPGGISNMVTGQIAIDLNFQGPNITIVTACTSGTHAIGQAARTIAYGDADLVLTGGSEMCNDRLGLSGFSVIRALSRRNDNPEAASRPWDKDRDGFVLGDGAGALMLEDYDHAKARGAKIYCELVGFGASADAYHVTAGEPNGRGCILAMENALKDSGLNVSDIGYINAHGTSTPLADPIELAAIKHVFSGYNDSIAVSSTKSMTGHLLGAAGAIEAVFSVLSLRDKVLPPTINCDNLDENCQGLNLVQHTAQEKNIKAVMSNSFGFGGTNGVIIFQDHS